MSWIKNWCLILLIGIIGASNNYSRKPANTTSIVKVTYIANEGFLIEANHKKILIDALFGDKPFGFCDNPTERALQEMVESKGDFADVDLIAATHMHRDHFFATFVADHLVGNEVGTFISCEQSVDLLTAQPAWEEIRHRVIDMTPDSLMFKDTSINDIGVRVYRMAHGPYFENDPKTGEKTNRHRHIQNLGFLFTINEIKVFHCGDSSPMCPEDYEHFRLDKEHIDIAFLGRGFMASKDGPGIEILRNQIKPDHVVLMHIQHDQNPYFIQVADQVKEEFPSTMVFESLMESKEFLID